MKRPFNLMALCFLLSSFADVPGALGEGCSFENRAYFEGQVVCQDGSEMKCTEGGWEQTGNPCSGLDESEEVDQPEVGGPAEVQMPEEPQVPEVPEIPPATE
jgi:hypothetical protein